MLPALLNIRNHSFLRSIETQCSPGRVYPKPQISVSGSFQPCAARCSLKYLILFMRHFHSIQQQDSIRDKLFQILVMFSQAFLPLLLAPLIVASPTHLDRRQYISANDLSSGNCKDVMFLFARGSTEVQYGKNPTRPRKAPLTF